MLKPIPDVFHGIVASAIDAEGVFPHQCLYRCGDKHTMVALDLTPAETVYGWLKKILAKEKPDELIFGLDRFCKPGQGTTLGDCITGAWLAQIITVAADLRIADALSEEPLGIDELASRVGANRTRWADFCAR